MEAHLSTDTAWESPFQTARNRKISPPVPQYDILRTEGRSLEPQSTSIDSRWNSRWVRFLAACTLGIVSALITAWLPNAITLGGVPVGDIGMPLMGMQQAIDGNSPYDIALVSGPAAQYPFTTMVVLTPLLMVPVALVAPLFMGLSASVLAWFLTSSGKWWRLQLFLSVPFVMALYSVQWSPLFAAALVCPPLLFLMVVKPQLGLVLAVAGKWNRIPVILMACVVALSFIVRPTWLMEWWQSGILDHYEARIPLLVAPGFLLALGLFFFRNRRGRLLIAMCLVPQRYWYDQFLLFLIPRTWRQMTLLVVTSWLGISWCIAGGWDPASAYQLSEVWTVVVLSTHLPALGIVGWQSWQRRQQNLGD